MYNELKSSLESVCPNCGGKKMQKAFSGPSLLGGSVSSRDREELLKCTCRPEVKPKPKEKIN